MSHHKNSCKDPDTCQSALTTAQELTQRAEGKVLEMKDQIAQWVDQAEAGVKEQPVKALAIAAAAGYVLNQLPLRSIVSANLRVATSILPPALFLYGAAKLYQFAKEQQTSAPQKE